MLWSFLIVLRKGQGDSHGLLCCCLLLWQRILVKVQGSEFFEENPYRSIQGDIVYCSTPICCFCRVSKHKLGCEDHSPEPMIRSFNGVPKRGEEMGFPSCHKLSHMSIPFSNLFQHGSCFFTAYNQSNLQHFPISYQPDNSRLRWKKSLPISFPSSPFQDPSICLSGFWV